MGFDFSNTRRNAHLTQRLGTKMPLATSTGTTIVGCLFDGGVVIAADTRATMGPIVGDKNCEKIHYLTEKIRCAGAGTAADTEFVTKMISSNLRLHELNSGRPARVATALTMLKQHLFGYQGHVGAALVLGGFDDTGANLFTVAPHGSTDKLPYVTMGSGSLAAMSVFETRWRPGLSEADAKELAADAIAAGIFNDLGSGSNVDLCVIRKDQTLFFRGYRTPNERAQKELNYKWRRGTTAVAKTDVRKFITEEVVFNIHPPAAAAGGGSGSRMDLD